MALKLSQSMLEISNNRWHSFNQYISVRVVNKSLNNNRNIIQTAR